MNIRPILQSRFDSVQLAGYCNAMASQDDTLFFAYTLLHISSEEFKLIHPLYLSNSGYSARLNNAGDNEKTKKYNPDGSFQYKSLDECLEENIYQYFTCVFSGVLFQGNWYVIAEYIFHTGEEDTVVRYMDRYLSDNLEQPIIQSLFKPFCPDKPNHPFGQMPWVVGYLKEEAKTRVNRAYEAYINESVFIPLVELLRENGHIPYTGTTGLFSHRTFPLLYPHTKEKVMAIIKAETAEEHRSRLYYLLYLPAQKKVFEWTLPKVRPVPGFHVFYIMEDLAPYCSWGDCNDLYDTHITMDDNNFWYKHVMKKDGNNEYLYLKEIAYTNYQRDVYPDI